MHLLSSTNNIFRVPAFKTATMIKSKITFILSIITFALFGQNSGNIVIQWKTDIAELNTELQLIERPYFEKAFYPTEQDLPLYLLPLQQNGNATKAEVNLSNEVWETITNNYQYLDTIAGIKTIIKKIDKQSRVEFLIPTFKIENGQLKKLKSFSYTTKIKTRGSIETRGTREAAPVSPMASGLWYKIGVRSTGIQKVDFNFFQQNGIPTSGINPKNIRVFGYAEGMLNENPISNTPASMPEIPIDFQGEADGIFNQGDYFLFFAKAVDVWEWSHTNKEWAHEKHLYADTACYFINIGDTEGKRIGNEPEVTAAANKSFSTYENHQFHELENTNLLKTGAEWYGDYFDIASGLIKNFNFNFPNKTVNEKVHFKARMAVRSSQRSGNDLIFRHNGNIIAQRNNITQVSTNYISNYAVIPIVKDSFSTNSSSVGISIEYGYPTSGAVSWLDYLEAKTQCNLILNNNPLTFSQPKSVGSGNISEFTITSNSNSITVWDVTNPYLPVKKTGTKSGINYSFKAYTDSIKLFAAHNSVNFLAPFYLTQVNNQNLMSLVDIDYVLLSAAPFISSTQELAAFHNQFSNLSTAVVDLQSIYNEFSNGHPDIAAIRNFLQFIYNNASSEESRLKYFFIMGDGSYDPKNRISSGDQYIPAWQSSNSISPTVSFVSDDYYGFLDDTRGVYNNATTLDIGIGRFPARNTADAQGFVKKVKHYANSQRMVAYDGLNGNDKKSTFDDWKNKMLFVADDGSTADGYTNAHMTQTELIVNAISNQDDSYNINKVYLDAYNKTSTAGGGRYPDVNREIREAIKSGVFFASYIGHGGEVGWADEKVLGVEDINGWDNLDAMPVFVTATCEFSRFDDPSRTAAGELVILNPDGGAIAMVTTTRLVYGGISNNIGFSINFFEAALSEYNGTMPTLGDAMRLAKNNSPMGTNFNKLKFSLLGDPALKMAYPKYNVTSTLLNDQPITNADTLKALLRIKISGEIRNAAGIKENINGFVYPVVYDKFTTINTLNNNNTGNTISFENRSNVIYRGTATVTNGDFSYEFIVPKGINYTFGNGKISYYFANDTVDGKGFTNDIIVGGSSDSVKVDDEGPLVQLFMNDTNFIFGGVTDQSPELFALVSDENGINTSGTSLGHDITAVLDDDFANPIILNDFYSSELNDFRSGKVIYPLSELENGKHTLTFKVWDVNNNSGTALTEFIVANDAKLALKHVYNYPNPFTTNTRFLFEHNKTNQELDVLIKIFTISGKLVKSIKTTVTSAGNTKANPIDWDGLDDFGDRIGRGVYVYQLEVRSPNGETAQQLEKLVILR